MVALLVTAIITITIGAYMLMRSDYIIRVFPESFNRKKESSKSEQSFEEGREYLEYVESLYTNQNLYTLSKWGIILTVVGILSLAVYYAAFIFPI